MQRKAVNSDAWAVPGGDLTASLSVRNVTVTYANGTTALRDASFELGPGTICGLVGVKASYGRVPLWPVSNNDYATHAGPMTRTVTGAIVGPVAPLPCFRR